MDDAPVRIGLVGYGFGGRHFHAPLIASAAGAELAGVVTRSPERRAELAADHPGVGAFDSLADLAAAGTEAVAISTPVDTHVALALEAIGLGMAVVVDKPFALDAAAARGVVEAAERAAVTLSVYQNRRWDSDLLTVRRLLKAGMLGSVVRFSSAFERFDRSSPPAAGGGILRDFGSHLFDQPCCCSGPWFRLRRTARAPAGRRPGPRVFCGGSPSRRHYFAPGGQLDRGRSSAALPRHGNRGLLRRRRDGRPGGGADRRAVAGE